MLWYEQSETHNLILNVNKNKTFDRQKMLKGNKKKINYCFEILNRCFFIIV